MTSKRTLIKKTHIVLFPLLLILSCTQKEEVHTYPVFGSDPLKTARLIENKRKSLTHWAELDINSSVLLYVSAENAFSRNPDGNVGQLRALIKEKGSDLYQETEGMLYKSSNYLYTAVKLGMVKEIYWVLPYHYFADIPLAGKRIKEYLKNLKAFIDEDIDAMNMDLGCLTGRLSGTDTHICSPRTLQLISEPVIIHIDISFFPLYAEGQGLSKLGAMKRFFDEMAFRKLQVRNVEISYGTEGGYAKAMYRLIGDELFEGIKDPQIFRAESPPEVWKHRDMADNMLSGGEDIKVIEYLEKPLDKNPDDIPLRMLHATALAKAGRHDEAFNELSGICSEDVYYCYGFVDLGNMLADKKQYDSAGKFFRKAVESLSGDPYVKSAYMSFREMSGRAGKSGS